MMQPFTRHFTELAQPNIGLSTREGLWPEALHCRHCDATTQPHIILASRIVMFWCGACTGTLDEWSTAGLCAADRRAVVDALRQKGA